MAGKLDPWRMYYNKATYKISEIILLPDFDLKISPNPMDADILYADYLLLQIDGNIDYNVLTSLN